jgi:hypothetical protein
MATAGTLAWLTAISTAVAALGTLAAVLTTLYFNVWRPCLKRPLLTLSLIEESEWGVSWTPGSRSDDDWSYLTMIVRNTAGRNTAYDAQVLVTISVEIGDGEWHDFYIQQPLTWKGGQSLRRGIRTTSIPPGVAREILALIIGEPNAIWAQLAPITERELIADIETGQELSAREDRTSEPDAIAAAVAVFPLTKENVVWVYRSRTYRFRFTVTARDFDAVTVESFLSFSIESEGDQERLHPHWSDFAPVREASLRAGV